LELKERESLTAVGFKEKGSSAVALGKRAPGGGSVREKALGMMSTIGYNLRPHGKELSQGASQKIEKQSSSAMGLEEEGLSALTQGPSAVALGKRPMGGGSIGKKATSKIGIKMHSSGKEPSQEASPDSHWEDIVLPCEFKLRISGGEDVRAFSTLDGDVLHDPQNISKLVWSDHILRTDPCCRFTFGITVGDYQMRLWFFARSHVMVTDPFNFVQVSI
jgi:hypothetical protein